ncbi:MAG TPA: hypothetical protein DCY88_07915 [Cyanobacteria bacterium UBA11372]|nr:hypothetical protein [Cyanobacteria bacterium UBA11372]
MSSNSTFVRVWDWIRETKEFTCLDMCSALSISKNHAYWYIGKLLRVDHIVRKNEGRQLKRSKGEHGKYCLKLNSLQPPVLTSKKGKEQVLSPRQKVWNAIRIFTKFTLTDLQIASGSSYYTCKAYTQALIKAGYLKIVSKVNQFGGKQYTYQLIKNTGPKALKIRREGRQERWVVDPNTKKIYEIGKTG